MRTPDTDTERRAIAQRLVTDALYRAGRRDDLLVEDVSLDIDATYLPLPNVLDELEASTPLSPARLRVLLESEQVETAEVQACVRRMIFDDE